jgi:isoquinoline 1-oxidoreductase subunit beta
MPGKVATIARRTFIIGTAAIAGGIVVGVVAAKWPLANPLLQDLDDGEVSLNPYVTIDANGITITTPRADVGQGAYSVQAMLVAEELDVAWGTFAVDPGPPSAAYYNRTLFHESFPIPSTDQGVVARSARTIGGAVTKLLGWQITGGSSTVPDAYEKLRRAGATARAMLLAAAAQQTGLAVSALRTQDGAVVTPDGTRIPYTSLASAAALLDPPDDVVLKDPKDWRYLGRDVQRLDIVAKSTGTAQYGIRHRPCESAPRRGDDLGRRYGGQGIKRCTEGRADHWRCRRDCRQHVARVQGRRVVAAAVGPVTISRDTRRALAARGRVIHGRASGLALQARRGCGRRARDA